MVVLDRNEVEYLRNLGLALAQADRHDGLDGQYIKIISRIANEIVLNIDKMIGGIPGVSFSYAEAPAPDAEGQSHMPTPEPEPVPGDDDVAPVED